MIKYIITGVLIGITFIIFLGKTEKKSNKPVNQKLK